jgi:hypothetical protein
MNLGKKYKVETSGYLLANIDFFTRPSEYSRLAARSVLEMLVPCN